MCIVFTLVIAVKEFSIEELDSNNSEDELEESVDDEDVEDILQWDDDTVKHSFQLGNSDKEGHCFKLFNH